MWISNLTPWYKREKMLSLVNIKVAHPCSSFKRYFFFFYKYLNVSRFHKKSNNLSKKLREIAFLSNTTSGSYLVILSKQRRNRWFPSVLSKLHRPLPLSGSTFHSVTLGSFHWYAVYCWWSQYFHMHVLSYEIAGFCVFLVCVFDRHIQDSFRRCEKAPPSV